MSHALCKNKECADAWRKAKHYSGHCSHSCAVQCGTCTPAGDLVGVEPTAAYTLCKNSGCAANWRKAKHGSGYCTRSCAEANGALADETPDYTLCKNLECVVNWRKAKHVSGYCTRSCAEANGALVEETLEYNLCRNPGCAASWRKAKHVSGYCTLSCFEASGALVAETSLGDGPPPAVETSLVDGPPSAATDAFLNAAMAKMKETSEKRMETMARVVRGMRTNGDHGERMERTRKEVDVQANAVRREHAEDMADDLFLWYSEYSKESIVQALLDADFNEDDALRLLKSQTTSSSSRTHNRWNRRSQAKASM